MEWISSIRATIDYIESNLLTVNGVEEIASHIAVSPFYLQTGFRIMTGYSIGEYIRNRRLYLAALDVWADKEKIIDIAYRYGYDTPESFSKAFSRFQSVNRLDKSALTLGPIITTLLQRGELEKARRYISIYESESGLFDINGNIQKGREIYYY